MPVCGARSTRRKQEYDRLSTLLKIQQDDEKTRRVKAQREALKEQRKQAKIEAMQRKHKIAEVRAVPGIWVGDPLAFASPLLAACRRWRRCA